MFCLKPSYYALFVFSGYVVNTCVDFGGYGIEASLGKSEAVHGLRFGDGFGESRADCRVYIPVGGEGEEFAKFGDITEIRAPSNRSK